MIRVKPFHNSVEHISPVLNKNLKPECGVNVSDIYDPLVKLLKVCGLYSARYAETSKPRNKLHFMYCLVIQVIVFVLCFRYFSVFRNGTSQLYTTIGLVGYLYYYIIISVGSFVCFVSNWSHLASFLAAIDKYDKKYGMSFDMQKTRQLHRNIIKIVLGINVVSVLICTPLMALWLEGTNLLLTSNLTPFERQVGPTFRIVVIVFGVFSLVSNLIVFSNVMFLLCNLRIFKLEFLYIRNKIEDLIEKHQLENIGTLRLQHEHIIELVEKGNPIFRHSAGLSYCYGIPIICLMLYGATTRSFDIADIVAMAAIIVMAVFGMFVITFMGAHMCEAAHSPLHDLFKADIHNESQKTVNQIQLFVTRLAGSPIGVSVYGLFVIDHSTILMVFGTIISYAVIVVQFSIPLTCDSTQTNITAI